VQAATAPDEVRTLLASETQAVIWDEQALGGSQVSPREPSIRPFPHPGQSLSVVGPQDTLVGQYVSIGPQVRCRRVQAKVQAAALPDSVTMVLASFTHAVWMVVQAAGGSQVSPDSTVPLPQLGLQSLSLIAVQPAGQQASLLAQALCRLPFPH
jgi:hypothetical protein